MTTLDRLCLIIEYIFNIIAGKSYCHFGLITTDYLRGVEEYFATLQIRQVDTRIDQKINKCSGGMTNISADILLVFETICSILPTYNEMAKFKCGEILSCVSYTSDTHMHISYDYNMCTYNIPVLKDHHWAKFTSLQTYVIFKQKFNV